MDPQLQLDFLDPSGASFSFLSFAFLVSAFFSSAFFSSADKVGMKDKLSVRVLLPGNGDGCDAMSLRVWLPFWFCIGLVCKGGGHLGPRVLGGPLDGGPCCGIGGGGSWEEERSGT